MAALTGPLTAILGHPVSGLELALVASAALVAGALGVWLIRRITKLLRGWKASAGVKSAALVALMATGVSMDTNWMFWGTHLHVYNPVLRAFLFADLEEALMVFAIQARENTLRPDGDGKQGIQGVLVWVMSGLAMLPAWIEAGWMEGTVRALAGPGLAALLWHFALGLEFKIVRPKAVRDRALTKIARNLRERLMARLGVTAPDQSALEIRQDRALAEVVRLTLNLETFHGRVFNAARARRLRMRLAEAMRRSGAGEDPRRQAMILRELAVIRHAGQLAEIPIPSPWDRHLAALANGGTGAPADAGANRRRVAATASASATEDAGASQSPIGTASPPVPPTEERQRQSATPRANGGTVTDISSANGMSLAAWAELAAPVYRDLMDHTGKGPTAPRLMEEIVRRGLAGSVKPARARSIRAEVEKYLGLAEDDEADPEPEQDAA